jgi:UDP-glucose 4-epimerase
VAGAYGAFGERHDPETHLVPNLLKVVSGELASAAINGTDYPTRDGTAVRDYLHVLDLADAHLRALDHFEPGRFRVFNLGTGTGYTVREVLEAVRRVTAHPVPAVEKPRRPGDPPTLVASNARANAELGWSPRRTLDDMVADAWAHMRSSHTRRASSSSPGKHADKGGL